MAIQRREALYLLACAGGWPVVAGSAASAEVLETSVPEQPTPAGAEPMELVLGIGGLFFRAHDPKALAQWYRSHLGVNLVPSGSESKAWQTEAGPTAFQPFSMTSKYLGEPQQMWMVNFRVRDLDRMATQLRATGVEVAVDPESSPYGRFARLHDPEGNPIELWEPAKKK